MIFRLVPLVVFLDVTHEVLRGLGFGDVELVNGNSWFLEHRRAVMRKSTTDAPLSIDANCANFRQLFSLSAHS